MRSHVRGIALALVSGLGLQLRAGLLCLFVVLDPVDLTATIVVAQAFCLTISSLSQTLNADGNKVVCAWRRRAAGGGRVKRQTTCLLIPTVKKPLCEGVAAAKEAGGARRKGACRPGCATRGHAGPAKWNCGPLAAPAARPTGSWFRGQNNWCCGRARPLAALRPPGPAAGQPCESHLDRAEIIVLLATRAPTAASASAFAITPQAFGVVRRRWQSALSQNTAAARWRVRRCARSGVPELQPGLGLRQ